MADDLSARAAGRCECTGECGESHGWTREQPAQRCRAPLGCRVQRKTDNPSSWILAGTDSLPIAYPEFYADRIETVSLAVVRLPQGPKLLCGYCRSRPMVRSC